MKKQEQQQTGPLPLSSDCWWIGPDGNDIRDPRLVAFLQGVRNNDNNGGDAATTTTTTTLLFDPDAGSNYADFLSMLLADEATSNQYFLFGDLIDPHHRPPNPSPSSASCFRSISLKPHVDWRTDDEFRALCENAVRRVRRHREDVLRRKRLTEKSKRTKTAQLVAENKSIFQFFTRKPSSSAMSQKKRVIEDDGFW
jgi:hypothetical protein